jgi:hypothetical protein
MAYSQEYVNQLVREAASQAGGTLSYTDVSNAAANLGIPASQVAAAMATGVITGAPAGAFAGAPAAAVEQPTASAPKPSLVDQILASSDTSKWSGEGKGSARANAEDMANILSGIGITDINQLGTVSEEVPIYGLDDNYQQVVVGTQPRQTFVNKLTGEAVPNTYGERQTGDAFGGTYSGKGNTGYRVQFTPDGKPVFYTSEQSSSSLPELMPLIQLGLVAAGAGGLFNGLLGGAAGAAGGAGVTEAAFLAADAAQLAAQGLSESAIASTLGSYGSTAAANLAASMAANGLDVATMTQQLGNLGTNTGLMSQTGSSADFLAADALQLQGQVGNNFAAIEQNLIASGVDPLVAADISQQLAFNPGLTQADLATNLSNSFGNNIYDVNMAATYPTSSLPGSGGLLSDVAGGAAGVTAAPVGTTTGAPAATTGSGTGLSTSQIANLVKAGVGLLGAGGAASLAGGGGSNASFQAPTQQVPTNSPEYYNQLQQYYNAYLPQTPRDVVTPLQQWYNSSYGA